MLILQEPKFYSFKGDYLVASKQAVASPTDMNVLYVAVDNGIKVAVAGYSAGQVTITSSNGSFGAVKKESKAAAANQSPLREKL